MVGDLPPKPLREFAGAIQAGLGKQKCDLLAAEAGSQIDRSHGAPDDLAYRTQDIVARIVTVAIVDALEVIDVDEDQRHRSAIPVDCVEHVSEPLVERATIRQAGEWIRECALTLGP